MTPVGRRIARRILNHRTISNGRRQSGQSGVTSAQSRPQSRPSSDGIRCLRFRVFPKGQLGLSEGREFGEYPPLCSIACPGPRPPRFTRPGVLLAGMSHEFRSQSAPRPSTPRPVLGLYPMELSRNLRVDSVSRLDPTEPRGHRRERNRRRRGRRDARRATSAACSSPRPAGSSASSPNATC